jgi:hypothetical protein
VLLRDDREHQIPESWRTPFEQVVEAFLRGDFELSSPTLEHVEPIDPAKAASIRSAIEFYGSLLAPLDSRTWERSVYLWVDGSWEFIVDLTMIDQPISDLAVHAKLLDGSGEKLNVWSVHVP